MSKLNRLASATPAGAVLLAAHLERLGFSRDLQNHYVRAGWLARVGRGAFVRPHEPPTWQGAVYALRTQAGLPLHVGATTALGLLGRAHYLAVGGDRGALDLFTPARTALPRWFTSYKWSLAPRHTRTDVLPPDLSVEEHPVDAGSTRLPLAVASAERAMLECLYLMPAAVDPAAARELMEGLVDLRPRIVASLLRGCGSVRVKRLFLMLADRAGHRWLRHVDLSGVDLGRGKRSVAGGGVYLPEHQLSVPSALAGLEGR